MWNESPEVAIPQGFFVLCLPYKNKGLVTKKAANAAYVLPCILICYYPAKEEFQSVRENMSKNIVFVYSFGSLGIKSLKSFFS